MSTVAQVKFTGHEKSTARALDSVRAAKKLPQNKFIIMKPNLTNADKPPVTIHVEAAEAVYKYCKSHSKAEIAIGEVCGDGVSDRCGVCLPQWKD